MVMPIVDLRLRLRLDAAPLTREARILVVMHNNERFGLLVDAVRDVVRFADNEIEPPPPSLSPTEAPFLSGIGRHNDGEANAAERLVILLSLDAVLAFEVRR